MHSADDLWNTADGLGDQRAFYLLEQFVADNVFHVDSAVWNGAVVRQSSADTVRRRSRYRMDGVLTTRLVARSAFGLHAGVSHTEDIRAVDGRWYFLETSARVGGAHIADLIEAATGANFWAELAKIEAASARGQGLRPPPDLGD